MHHFMGEREESRDGSGAQEDRGAAGEEEGGVRREAQEQAGHAAQVGGGEEGADGGEARGGDHLGGGDGRQVPRQGRGTHQALRTLESVMKTRRAVTHDVSLSAYVDWDGWLN
jgi:hypothetical protein